MTLVPFRPRSPSVRAIRVPAGPSEVVPGRAGIWVASRGTLAFPEFLTNKLVRVDPSTLEVDSIRGLGDSEIHVAAAAEAVWATNARHTRDGDIAAPELARIAPETGRILARVRLGRARTDAATGVVASSHAVWVGLIRFAGRRELGRLLRVDPATNRVVAHLCVGRGPTAMAAEGDRLWVVDAAARSISVVDTRANRVTATLRAGREPSAIASGFGSVWVADAGNGAVLRVDPLVPRVLATIPVGGPSYSLAVNGDGIWAPLPGNGAIVRIDPAANTLAETISLGGDPLAVAADGPFLWVTMNSDERILRIDPLARPRR
jgi:YVTN family beta-propeller protein